MQRSYTFPGWCVICRWTAVGAISVGTMAVLGAATSDHRPAPTVVRLAAQPEGTGLDQSGWTVRDPAEQRRSLDLLLSREKARRTVAARVGVASVPIPAATTAAAPVPMSVAAVPASALGSSSTLAAPQAVSVAIKFALAQVGKPYVWGATGPDSYDCSGLVQRSYRMAGVALPRTSREQARVGTAVELPNLLPGDLLFWAYDPSDLSTVHHVAMYLGDGKIVQAPQPGEFVEVTSMWLSGYAGAVRVATGPATAALPPVPAGVPGTGMTPVGDAMPDGSPPPSVGTTPDTPARPGLRSASSGTATTGPSRSGTTSGTTSPSTSAPSTAPGSTSPGTSSPGTTSPGTTSPAITSPGITSPGAGSGTTSPGTTSPGTATGSTSAGDGASGSSQPSGTATGSGPATPSATPSAAPATTSPTTTDPTTPAPTTPAPTTAAPTTAAPTTAPSSSAASSSAASSAPATTPPPPAPSPSADGDGAATSSAATGDPADPADPKPSVSPLSPTPSPT